MPKLYEGRTDYFQPSFEALVRAQVGHTLYTNLAYGILFQAIISGTLCFEVLIKLQVQYQTQI